MPADESYQKTKRLKQEGTPLLRPFHEMAEWITEEHKVPVLNVIYKFDALIRRPRIEVIVETEAQLSKLRTGRFSFSTSINERRASEQFTLLLTECGLPNFRTKDLFVIFSAFEPIARIDVLYQLSEEMLDQFRQQLKHEALWKIVVGIGQVIFFFYTAKQMSEWEHSCLRDEWTRQINSLIQPFDEFGYFGLRPLNLILDSKENLDQTYGGSLFYYFR
ncbi:hypothetical protein [Prosthecobacter sp.]|uniref:hypothetical protein n=1 Tax=Prosthecobacter sp. TaxID=1965333 RepID=UPI0024884C28|nr:hypothetical protein [Prosthecobacter sp.]MDI1311215.1 hypothetical protein [Prosthecobacter sp.]